MTAPLGPTARNLVAAARSGLDPSAEIAARVRARVAIAVGGAASTGAATAPVPIKAIAPTLALGKLAAILTATGALVVGGWFAMHRTHGESQLAIAPPAPSLEVDSRSHARFATSAHDDMVVAPVVTRSVPRIKAVVAVPTPAVVAATAPPTLAREVALIDATIASLRANDPSAALATTAIYNRETQSKGQLAEDAAALEIDARCRAHEPVDDQLAAFTVRWPSSAQRAHLTKNCPR